MILRQVLALLLVALCLAAGRGIRHLLLLDAAGQWRESTLLQAHLPPTPEPSRPVRSGPPASPLLINHCPAESLILLPGVGPTLAARIIASRQAAGAFSSAADLQRVKGIGDKISLRVAPYLRFTVSPGDTSASGADGEKSPSP
ncbi:MAG: helix-hairpin-helix domain-containing protein [bacterium]